MFIPSCAISVAQHELCFSDAGNDFMPLSADMSLNFEEGESSKCDISYLTLEDDICEYTNCSYEYFLSLLNTNNHRVILVPSQTAIFIEEDLVIQNCSEL